MSDICNKCGEEVIVRDGCEHTGFCDDCAQGIAVAAAAFVEEHKPDYDELEGTISASAPATFMLLCEAVLPDDAKEVAK